MNMNEAQPRLPFKYLSVEQMNSLPTSRLLAYYKKHRECLLQMSRNARYCTDDGKFVNQHIQDIKDILNTRPHVDK